MKTKAILQIKAINQHLEQIHGYSADAIQAIDTEDYEPESWDDCRFCVDGIDLMVLNEDERRERIRESVEESLWAYRASWLRDIGVIPHNAVEAIERMQEELCEDATPIIRALVDAEYPNFGDFVEEDTDAPGRLASWDGEEDEQTVNGVVCQTFYVYRM